MKVGIKNKHLRGFTIVELLVVIVVIAILAAITIVAYNGIKSRAVAASLQNTVSQAVKQLEIFKPSDTGLYPSTLAAANLSYPSGTTLNYYYNSGKNSYCVESGQSNQFYSARSNDSTVKNSKCIENGLAGWWTLNGNVNDQSGNGLNGSVTGAVLTTGQNGQANGAYLTDGVDDIISFGNSPLLSPTNTGFSLSVWFRRDGAVTSEQAILRKDNQYQFGIASAANVRNLFGTTGGTTGWVAGNDFAQTYATGTWYQGGIVWDGSTLKSYVNGALVRTATVTGEPVVNAAALTSSRATSYFPGAIDDVRIFSRALTGEEMAALYADGSK